MSALHTPGPWRWELNVKGKNLNLCGGKPTFDKTVMDFTRWGMGGATPRFNEAVAGGKFNIMEPASKWAAIVEGREHHKDWFQGLSHPDALLIAAAPDLLEASENALEVLEILDATIKGEDAMDWPTYAAEAMGALKMAIAKAKGEK